MPNYCDYNMIVSGKKDNVDEFVSLIQRDYNMDKPEVNNYKKHMYRVFEATVWDEHVEGLMKEVHINGYCAWSVNCCMMPGAFSYYDYYKNDYEYGTHLLEQSKLLDLQIIISSEEPGMCFYEFYNIDAGILCQDECLSMDRAYPSCYDTVNEYNDDLSEIFGDNSHALSEDEFKHASENDYPIDFNDNGKKIEELFMNAKSNGLICQNVMCDIIDKK